MQATHHHVKFCKRKIHKSVFFLFVTLLLSTFSLQAQNTDKKELLEEALRRLDKVEAERIKETAKKALESKKLAAQKKALESKLKNAKTALNDQSKVDLSKSQAQAQTLLNQAKKELKAQGIDTDALSIKLPILDPLAKAPKPLPVKPATSEKPSTIVKETTPKQALSTPAPKPVKSNQPTFTVPSYDPKNPPTNITLGAPDSLSVFDNEKRVAVFTKNVYLKHPNFEIWCDQLQVYMEEQKATANRNSDTTGGIRIAIATGKKVSLRKMGDDGKYRLGQCTKATYNAKSKILVLSGYPQIANGQNLIKATDAKTKMILYPSGKFDVKGKSTASIIDNDQLNLTPN